MNNTKIPTGTGLIEVKTNLALAGNALTGETIKVQSVDDQSYNKGFLARRKVLIGNGSIELCDRLHIDLFNSNLLNKVGIKVKIERSKNKKSQIYLVH